MQAFAELKLNRYRLLIFAAQSLLRSITLLTLSRQ